MAKDCLPWPSNRKILLQSDDGSDDDDLRAIISALQLEIPSEKVYFWCTQNII